MVETDNKGNTIAITEQTSLASWLVYSVIMMTIGTAIAALTMWYIGALTVNIGNSNTLTVALNNANSALIFTPNDTWSLNKTTCYLYNANGGELCNEVLNDAGQGKNITRGDIVSFLNKNKMKLGNEVIGSVVVEFQGEHKSKAIYIVRYTFNVTTGDNNNGYKLIDMGKAEFK